MVTGTTRSAAADEHHHRLGAVARLRGQLGEKLGVAGMAEAGAVERLLVDRVGDEPATSPASTRSTARVIERITAPAWPGSGCPGAGAGEDERAGQDRQAGPEGRCCRGHVADLGDRDVEAQGARPLAEQRGVADENENRPRSGQREPGRYR